MLCTLWKICDLLVRNKLDTVLQQETPESQINRYKTDFRFFHNLRISVRQRYAETIDYKDYEQKVRNLMNQHITSSEVRPITELVNIFDHEAFATEVEKIEGVAAKADTIAYSP